MLLVNENIALFALHFNAQPLIFIFLQKIILDCILAQSRINLSKRGINSPISEMKYLLYCEFMAPEKNPMKFAGF